MRIEIFNTHIEVSPYKQGDALNLEYELQVYDKFAHKVVFQCFQIDEEKNILYLPRGYNVIKLEQIFGIKAFKSQKNYTVKKINFKLMCQPRDDYQFQAMNFLGCQDRYEKFKNSTRFNLELGTGIGKTYCAIAAIWHYQVCSCIILHIETLIDQWKDRIKKYTNIVDREIYVIRGKASIDKLFKDGTSGYKIFLISHRTLAAYAKSNGNKAIGELFEYLQIGIKIYDEAHLEFANIMKVDFNSNVPKNFYLTATAGRTVAQENKLYVMALGSAPSLSLSLPKDQMKVVACIIQYNSKPNRIEETLLSTQRGLNQYRYLEYCVYKKGKEDFFKAFDIAFNTLKEIDGQVAILVGMKKIIADIHKYIDKNFPEYKDMIGELHSDIDKKDKAEQLKKKIIITTYKSFGTGTDIPNMLGVINCEPYSSYIMPNQLIGRLRNKGYYIEILDIGIKKREKQFEKVKIYINRVVKKLIVNEL